MSGYVAVDLSRLPAPDVIVAPDFEAVLSDLKAMMIDLHPAAAEVLDLETEPLTKFLELVAHWHVLTLGRVNDAARAMMLAFSWGGNLDHLAALFGVQRLTITPADTEAVPPVAAVMEGDEAFRARVQLALEGFSTAGPSGAYLYHALSADGAVLDASVTSPSPGDIMVTVLSREGNGSATPELVDAVSAALNDERVRPLCDNVAVQPASITEYTVSAELSMFAGPDPEVARAAAETAVRAYVADCHRLGRAVRLSGLYRALHQPGVEAVSLTAPAADIECDASHAPWCTAVSVTKGS